MPLWLHIRTAYAPALVVHAMIAGASGCSRSPLEYREGIPPVRGSTGAVPAGGTVAHVGQTGGTAVGGSNAIGGSNVNNTGVADAALVDGGCYRDPYLPDNYQPPCEQPKAGPDCTNGWCVIDAGCFIMGSPWCQWNRAMYAEDPVQVTLTHRFRMQQFEATQLQWTSLGLPNPSCVDSEGNGACIADDCPVTCVNWLEVAAYANLLSEQEGWPPCYTFDACQGELGKGMLCENWHSTYASVYDCPGYRLPTGAEWEYAARAGTRTSVYTGDIQESSDSFLSCYDDSALLSIAWYCANSGPLTHPVGQKVPNGWGLYDMIGNVSEITSSEARGYGKGPYVDWGWELVESTSSIIVHGGPILQTRGGMWNLWPSAMRVSHQFGADMSGWGTGGGFRLVQTLSGAGVQ